MTFLWPTGLYLVLLVPLFALVYFLLQLRRQRIARSFTGNGTAPAAARRGGGRRHLAPYLFLVGLAILTVAMARPQAVVSLPKVEGTIILAFDVSGSMAATDFKPTRMDAAKAAVQDFVKHQPPYVQIGVVAFSDSGFSVQVPTNDQATVLTAIQRLVPQRGTSVANGILASLNAIAVSQGAQPIGDTLGEPPSLSNLTPMPTPSPTPVPKGTYTSASIILLSDGENNESPDPLAAAQTAAQRGVRIYTVGLGSPEGTTLHINGFTVFTQLDEATLQQISQTTGGTYYNAQTEQDLLKIYQELNSQVVAKPEKTELTSLFAGAGIFVLLFGSVFSLAWSGRLP